jgi:hypothetical protein
MRVSLSALLGGAAVVVATATGASAQVINLSGQFQCVKECAAPPGALAYITQANDWQLNLVNEAGIGSHGWIDRPGHLYAEAWHVGAIYSPDGLTIQFENGTVWQRVVEAPMPPPPPAWHHRHHHRHQHYYHYRPLPPANS